MHNLLRVDADRLRADLEALTRIPSISLSAYDQAHVQASAEATADLGASPGIAATET